MSEEKRQILRHLSVRKFLGIFLVASVLLLALSWLLLDQQISTWVETHLDNPPANTTAYSMAVIGVLASDLLLPIPSSAIITHAGLKLGPWLGAMVSFAGITLGAIVGFAMVRLWGAQKLRARMNPAETRWLQKLIDRFGIGITVVLRPVPIFSEASVLLLALGGMRFKTFLLWVSLSNASMVGVFTGFGAWATQGKINDVLTLFISVLIPVLLMVITQILLLGHVKAAKDDDVAA
ncbi:MAG: VTT domain-containing protein [Planctomycetota bacterium]|nr:VTT domain-containing protein [Planctomycetota bacterium]